MKKQKQQEPLITSVASVVKNVIDTRPFDVDEIRAEKREMHRVLKDAFAVFTEKLKMGAVDLSTSLDLERLVKLRMLIMGEPEGVAQTSEQETVVTFSQPLSLDDPDVRSVYKRLTESYNQQNDGGSNE